MRKVLWVLIAQLALAGCKFEFAADLYTSDLRIAADSGQVLITTGTIALPITSASKCDEQTDSIAQIMAGVVDSFSPRGCEKRGFDAYLIADIDIQVSRSRGTSLDTLFGIAVEEHNRDLYMRVLLHQEKYQTLNKRASSRYFQEIELDESIVRLVLNNDDRAPVKVFVDEAFVQGIPVLSRSFNVDRRGKVEIILSNVGVAHLGHRGWAYGFRILRPKYRE